ncbi:MAG: response regulator [Marinirhabdus sp.]|nr:response regulator [Marinirhabdus sp.]
MNNLKILLVDDDQDDRQLFAKALQELDMNVELHLATNGKSCLQFLESNKDDQVHLVFLDLNMPVMNGFECLEKIKGNKAFDDIVIAIYSTSAATSDIEQTFEKGANIYIHKPAKFSDLKTSLKQVIKTNWAYKENNLDREHFLLKI